jgi:threonine dehydrogenase-like Zn-dependent dehydrogenase
MQTARLAVLTGVFEFDIFEYPIPKAMDGGLVIKTEAASICGSDLHIARQGTDQPKNIGHEFTGVVVELGPKANDMIHCFDGDLHVGDRIAVYPHITCGKCETCLKHGPGVCIICENNFCYGGGMMGKSDPLLNVDPTKPPHFKGGFGEYVHIFPGTFVWKVPDDMPATLASILDPIAVAMRAIELAITEVGVLLEGITTTTTALVIGPGPIGIATAMILRYMGVERLIISGRRKKLETAKEISRADDVLNIHGLSTDERIEKLLDMTHGGADVVINCANHPSAQIEGLQMVRKLGTYIEVGLPFSFGPGNEVEVDLPKLIFQRNARITSVVGNTAQTFDRAFRLMKKQNELPFSRLITHEFNDLEDLLPTIKKMQDEDYLKGVMVFN